MDPPEFTGPSLDLSMQRTRAAGASAVRLVAYWSDIAPRGTEQPRRPGEPRVFAPPRGFDATNPADPAYRWTALDAAVRAAVAQGLDPILCLYSAPLWAEDAEATLTANAPWRIDAEEFGKFAVAVATRYSGTFGGLPRVRSFQAWNEPNLSVFLNPQVTEAPVGETFPQASILSADQYRNLANSFARGIHSVHEDNIVVAGGLAPFSIKVGFIEVAPLAFMRKLLCMSADDTPLANCPAPLEFDAWSTHPYTSGGPTHHARLPEDVSLGDLPEMKHLLDAAVRARRVVSSRPVEFWVTEFSWDSSPADRYGVPAPLLTRWTAEGLYRMWLSGVSLVTWWLLRDQTVHFQSGLYYRGATVADDRPKPMLAAFRFPFVAFPAGKRISVWGRTPRGAPAVVLVEQQRGRKWKKLGTLRTDANGIFQARLARVSTGLLVRARTLTGGVAVPFSLRAQPDVLINPFGDAPPGVPF